MSGVDLVGFYEASASVAGALIGLLFVAMSVARERPVHDRATAVYRIRASASMTAFLNALAVSLFNLLEGPRDGAPSIVVSISGLLFVSASVTSLRNERPALRDVLFLLWIVAALVAQLIAGIAVDRHPHDVGLQQDVAGLVVVFFLIGITRAWELIEGPRIGLRRELAGIVHKAAHQQNSGGLSSDKVR